MSARVVNHLGIPPVVCFFVFCCIFLLLKRNRSKKTIQPVCVEVDCIDNMLVGWVVGRR
jgi:hypothetical protein